MVQNTVCTEASASFNGSPSRRKRQEFSPGVEAEIGSGILDVQRPFVRGNNRFSLFKWFKRGYRDSTSIGKRRRRLVSSKINPNEQNSSSSSTESIDTFCSTTTVRSFAFQNGAHHQRCNGLTFDFPRQAPGVGPFGAGAVKLKLLEKGNNSAFTNFTSTLPNTFSRKRDITERYSLQPSNSFNSCGNIPIPVNKSSSSLKGKKVHVKGKRRAPNPPEFKSNPATNTNVQQTIKTGRRRRPAPRPPEKSNLKVDKCSGMDCGIRDDLGTCPIISTDTLILRGGVLLPKRENKSGSECRKKVSNDNPFGEGSSDIEVLQIKEKPSQSLDSTSTLGRAMPRPWYKRSVFENSRDSATAKKGDFLRNSTSLEKREESGPSTSAMTSFPFESSLSKLNFFHRTERNPEDRRREAKRKSGISILTNISELDKEAIAIVQEEQARTKASTLLQNTRFIDLEDKIAVNEQLVQNMVASTMESSPKRSTRALISKFNAISNLTKVNVNSNFFTKNSPTGESSQFHLNDQIRGHQTKTNWMRDTGSGRQKMKEKQSIQHEPDLSRYFLPHQRSPKLSSDFNQGEKKLIESDHHIGKMPRPHENSNASTDNDIPEKKANENEKLSSFNKLPIEEYEKTNEHTSSFKADRTERIIMENLGSKQKQHNGDNRISVNENTKKYSFPIKARESSDNNKATIPEKNDSFAMSKKLDMIFDEIDKQLQINNNKSDNSKNEIQAGTSNQVTKLLDFLVEAEKAAQEQNSLERSTDKAFSKKEESGLINSESKQMSPKGKLLVLNTEEDSVTTDLKEMLKEMKHSLPKRSKIKKAANSEPEIPKINNEPSTSTFCDLSAFSTHLKKDDLTKSEIVPLTRTKLERLRDGERQKVSSGVQTSGNLRKVNNLPMEREITFTNIITEEQNSAPKLMKNKFHLIRPKDFAEIEAIKMVKKSYQENTYANVIEQSLYANAMVPPPKSVLNTQPSGSMIKEEQVKKNNHLFSPRLDQKERLILSGE